MKYRVKLNGKVYEVEVEKGEAQLLKEYDAVSAPSAPVAAPAPVATTPAVSTPATSTASGNAVPSPLPGTVVEVKVSVGQTVKRGDVVMLIEAMKMENEISAPTDGKVLSILVQKGSKVEQGTPILEIG